MSKAPRTVFACTNCGAQSPKWLGRCPDCGAWNTFAEEAAAPPTPGGGARPALGTPGGQARLYADVDMVQAERISTGIGEFDRVLGGGLVPGQPGAARRRARHRQEHVAAAGGGAVRAAGGPVLYCSGEESEHQVKARGERLGVGRAPLYLLAETCTERILDEVQRLRPALLIVDSIQTVYSTKLTSAPGTVGQIRETATQLLFAAKGQNLPTVLVGHVTKDGGLAGPKVLEHVVDTVLYFEGERHHTHRVVRAVKNRFGAVSELGVFEMTGSGLQPVPNPSALFLAERQAGAPGSAVLCCMEGSRPILVEVQALVSSSVYGSARRMTNGVDQQRLALLLAVLEKRAGLNLAGEDVFVNVAGGFTVDERAADLGIVAAVVSSIRNRPVRAGTAVFGEVGLAGEVRATGQSLLRVREAAQMGFTRCVVPAGNVSADDGGPGCEVVGVRTVAEALDEVIGWD